MSITQEKEKALGVPAHLRLDERIYRELLARIHDGRYELGGRLPTEEAMAKEFEVSRPVIRTALARLREVGLIESKRGSGSYVSSGTPDGSSGFSPLTSVLDISACYAYRIAIESESAALAAANPDRDLRAALQECVAAMDHDIEAGQLLTQRDLAFHGLIATMSQNRFIVESLQMLRPHILFIGRFVRSFSPSGYVQGKAGVRAEHHQIADAIMRGDAKAASLRMREHILASERRVFKGER